MAAGLVLTRLGLGLTVEEPRIRKITMYDGRCSCGTLLADLDVHHACGMQILRHAKFSSLTVEIYTLASSKATRDALKRLGYSPDA